LKKLNIIKYRDPILQVSQLNVSKKGSKIIITWRKEDPEDVAEARKFFTKLTMQGWLAARHDGRTQRILDFVPEHGELWFIPLSEGG